MIVRFAALALALSVAASVEAAAAGLAVHRIGLYFPNGGAAITVTRGAPLQASADLSYSGSGLLQGQWEVDGRTVALVAQHLAGSGPVTLRTPETPSLPTFDPGTHVVRFVVMTPKPALPAPSLLYFVLPEGPVGGPQALGALDPADNATCLFGPLPFSWEGIPGDPVYVVQFFEETEGKPIFSAYTRERAYTLPEPVFRGLFAPGRKYWWKVTGHDAASRVVGSSPLRCFVPK